MNAIETKKLTKIYEGETAVDGLDLTVRQGELLALLGVNGAGKSTTIRMLTCITEPTSGTASVMGYDVVRERGKVKSCVSVSPQETAVAGNLTVEENLNLMCAISGKDRSEVEKVMKELELDKVRGKQAKKLSGGWQRRLSIGMSLVQQPQVLFLDEPTLGLDVIARRELWQVINGLKGRVTVVLTTHYMEEAQSLADRIAIMAEGRLRITGAAEEIITASSKSNFEDAFVYFATGGGEGA